MVYVLGAGVLGATEMVEAKLEELLLGSQQKQRDAVSQGNIVSLRCCSQGDCVCLCLFKERRACKKML